MKRFAVSLAALLAASSVHRQALVYQPFSLTSQSVNNDSLIYMLANGVKCNPLGTLNAVTDCTLGSSFTITGTTINTTTAIPFAPVTGFYTTANNLTATGSGGSGCYAVTAGVNYFSSVPVGTCAILPTVSTGLAPMIIVNGDVNALAVYPQASNGINNLSNGTAISVGAKTSTPFYGINAGRWGATSPSYGLGFTANYSSTGNTPSYGTTTGYVMVGLAMTFTPATSGKILVNITALMNSAVASVGVAGKLYCGNGTAPANGAAVTGTQLGAALVGKPPGLSNAIPITWTGVYTGTAGTAGWCDLAYSTPNTADAVIINGYTASLAEVS